VAARRLLEDPGRRAGLRAGTALAAAVGMPLRPGLAVTLTLAACAADHIDRPAEPTRELAPAVIVVPHGTPRLTGYVMTHEHPTYGMAFGGNYAFAGAAGNYQNGVMENGYTAACGGCGALSSCDHGEVKGSFTAALGALGRDMGDHASYTGPLHDSNSHLRYSSQWIKEAFSPTELAYQDSRMRIMVAFAVENEAMCEQLYDANAGNGGAGGAGYACSKGDSLASLTRQLDSLKAWAVAHRTWAEIAYSAADVRRIVAANKLAVILGVESEYAFGAESRTFDPVTRLEAYYNQGVRTFYLAHKLNSRLSGADIYYPRTTDAGKAIRATQAISGCFYYDDHVGTFPLVDGSFNYCNNDSKCGQNAFKGGKLFDACNTRLGEISEVNMADYVLLQGAGKFNGFAIYPRPPGFTGTGGSHMDGAVERNNLGLSVDGERVVRRAMQLGMIINLDHVSSAARLEIAQLAQTEFHNYPVNALHNNPNEMLPASPASGAPAPHEYDFDRAERDLIRSSGGMFGVRLGPLDANGYAASGVTLNCPRTSTESAKILAYLLDEGLHVGYSLDYATITEGVHSRTFEGCGTSLGTDQLAGYGSRVAEGLSHIGMMKKWHKELETIGLPARYLDRLKADSAEQFVQMWESSEYLGTH
jgi:microsomal dipeptidase-like Zn-dependent dipeptidase